MKNRVLIFILAIITVLFICSCDDIEATKDTIEYDADREKAPKISTDSIAVVELLVGDSYTWKVNIEASNGIDSVFVDGKLFTTYGNGQLKYSALIPVIMPNEDIHSTVVMVKDEIGFETTKTLTINKQALQSSFLIADFPYGGEENVAFLPANNIRRVDFPAYNNIPMLDYGRKNFAWADAKIKSDMAVSNIRFGSSGFNGTGSTAPNAPAVSINDWEKIVGFAEEASPVDASSMEKSSLRLNLYPRKGNMRTMIALDAPLNVQYVESIVARERVLRIDVFVDTDAVHPYAAGGANASWSGNLKPYGIVANNVNHTSVGLGMANTMKFDDRAGINKHGQDHGMITTMTKKDEWETLTFELNPLDKSRALNIGKVQTIGDVNDDEVNMFILVVSPSEPTNTSSATYYFKNFRIEKR